MRRGDEPIATDTQPRYGVAVMRAIIRLIAFACVVGSGCAASNPRATTTTASAEPTARNDAPPLRVDDLIGSWHGFGSTAMQFPSVSNETVGGPGYETFEVTRAASGVVVRIALGGGTCDLPTTLRQHSVALAAGTACHFGNEAARLDLSIRGGTVRMDGANATLDARADVTLTGPRGSVTGNWRYIVSGAREWHSPDRSWSMGFPIEPTVSHPRGGVSTLYAVQHPQVGQIAVMQLDFDRNNPPPLETLLDSARAIAESQHGEVVSNESATVDGYPARRSTIRLNDGAAVATLAIATDDRAFVVMFGSTEQAAFGAEGLSALNAFHLTHPRGASVAPSASPAPLTSSNPPGHSM
jgi:hypothetical protein